MDFSNIKKSLGDAFHNVSEKAKEIGNKTLEFAGDNLSKTALFIRDNEEYKKVLDAKRSVILAFDEKNEIEKEVMLYLTLWHTKAFIDTTTFRLMNKESSDIVILEEKYTLPIEMRVFFQGVETHRFSDLEAIKAWWSEEKRDYTGEKKMEEFTKKSPEKKEKISKNEEKKEDIDVKKTTDDAIDTKDEQKDPLTL